MEIFLIISGVVVVSTLLTLLTSCIVHCTLNPFRYFHEDWDLMCLQTSWIFYTGVFGLLTIILYSSYEEEHLHYIKTEWDENTGYYNVTVSGSEVKGINIIQKQNDN